ncbi:MAG: PQQ-binding-like beta-propeller repeat protein [Candidatus Latescibacter sp.]|nr:PQQ-binding-like beta-propeller repeat protein [Candidatus Latescibacter sp.]
MNMIIWSIFSCLCFLSSNQVFSQGFANSAWPMFGHDPGHTHQGVSAPPATNVLKWKFKADGPIFAPVIGEDGTIYAGSYDRHIYALRPDGTLKWEYEVDGPIRGSPAIGSDGTIYFGSSDYNIYALYPNGSLSPIYS